ncbi:MAG: glycosyltransferase family 2 protein [Rhodobacteraceae bacterium]|nr:glycosyltransferase family 2 protein [Paracoccaceae bacterium]
MAGLLVLDTLRWPTPFGSALRLYLGRGGDPGLLVQPKGEAVTLDEPEMVSGNVIVTGTAPEGDEALTLKLAAGGFSLPVSVPDPGLFDDLNVFVAQRHRETADQVAGWLGYHVAHHGLEALLLFDRAPPGQGREQFAQALQAAIAGMEGLKRAVLVTAPLPLGCADMPALGDPAMAPRAKDRTFAADPWRAALNQPVLYDILKWRFLSRAGAVIALDPCDILRLPVDGIGVFEACRQSHTGVMWVVGELIYPWRVRKGQVPLLADHICRAHPAADAPRSWAVAPRRLAARAVWLPQEVTGTQVVAEQVVEYDRAQSVLFAEAEVAALVNKDLLERDEALLERARDALGHRPVLPPERKAALVPANFAPLSDRVVIVTCMKNEGPFILEWLAWHRMTGVDDFLIYTNDCDDGTDRLLDLLQDRGLVQRRDNPFRDTSGRPQQSALKAAQLEPVLEQAGWIVAMDVDEFINVHTGGGRLPDLFAAMGEANMISMTWRLFGNSDIEVFEDRPVTEQFTRCAPHLIRRPHQAWGLKTLFRNLGYWDSLGVHRPRGPRGDGIKWVNGSGQPMPERMLRTGWRSAMDSYGYDLVTLNHYSVRSVESFLVKRDRGRVNHLARDQGEAYWFRMNNNDEQDLSIQRHSAALEAEIAALKSDPDIAALHEITVAAHQAKIAALLHDPSFSALHARLCSDRLRRLSRLHRHFGMNVFLRGPGVVPERVFEPDLPANFFFNTARPKGKAAE